MRRATIHHRVRRSVLVTPTGASFVPAAVRLSLFAALAASAACAEPREELSPLVSSLDEHRCYECHGDIASGNPAPPPVRYRDDAAPDPHQVHLSGEGHAPVACTDCHVVPDHPRAPGHVDDDDGRAEVVWGGLAVHAEAQPMYDTARKTCSGGYCHGGTLAGGGPATDPVWAEPAEPLGCDGCHAFPPPAPHTVATDCERCHSEVAGPDGTIVAAALHVDGNLQLDAELPCDGCHGQDGDSAPPFDTLGNTATTFRGVGAHEAHLGESARHAEIACQQCHTVPEVWEAEGHVDTDLPAELVWGDLAAAEGVEPSFDGQSCSNVYCHGATLEGGVHAEPIWTLVDGSQASCGSCHGNPPPAPHPPATDCETCHTEVAGPDGTIVAAALHVDGMVQVAAELPCDTCHGGDGDPAPPTDTLGNATTDARGVGAHQVHLMASDLHAGVPCGSCHVEPDNYLDAGHLDDALPAELVWGGLADAHGATPEFDGTSCSNTYCHGATLDGGLHPTPTWTVVDGSQATCGSCHGNPPPAPHPPATNCVACHSEVVDASGAIANIDLHVDGELQVSDDIGCASCHGSGGDPAPPVALDGATATTDRGVGAHAVHLQASDWRVSLQCSDCHSVPSTIDAPGHLDGDGVAEIVWGRRARLGITSPAWNGTSCSNVYCHGGSLPERHAGAHTEPIWTLVDGSQSGCGSCHGAPPGGVHPADPNCNNCHASVVGTDGSIIGADLHIDGRVQVVLPTP